MPLSVGTRLGPYEIIAPLGAGGMGEVYRARDTRLGRDVALKILPEEVANDASRRARFETEARAVAALNHPNIVAIFDVGEGYIVSELVEGESLRGVKFGLRKTIDLAVQLANGLAAAHAAGIVHRDLKPENILLTRDGRVKILDFGLAKVQPSRKAAAATETMRLQTEPGMVMGTAGYMSPEQVRGNDVDHHSDIFSFGVILYELLAGQRAFQGDTSVETMTAILKQDPPEMPESVPMPVRQIVARCLEKEPLNRFLSAGDLAFALSQSAGATPSSGSKVIAQRINWRWPAIAALAAIVGVVAGALIFRAPAAPVWMGVSLGGPEVAMSPRISPDGRTVAFTTMVDQQTQVAIMRPEAGDWAVLTHARDQGQINVISWASDGNRIYFDRRTETPRGIYSVPVLGGEPTLLLENAGAPEALPDGSLLVSRLNAKREMVVFRFWPESGKLQEFGIRVDSDNSQVRAFPGGLAAAVWGVPAGSATVTHPQLLRLDLATGRAAVLPIDLGVGSFDAAIAISRDGKSIAANSISPPRMVALPADGHASPRTLFSLPLPPNSADVGPDGAIYLDLQERPFALLRFASTGGHAERVTTFEEGSFANGSMPLLPDGRTIWYQSVAGRTRLVVLEKGKDAKPLVNTSEATASPVAVVGRDRVAFLIGAPGKQDIGIASIANGRVVRRISTPGGIVGAICASPDGKMLYFNSAGRIWAQPADGGQATAIHAGDAVSADPSGSFLILIAKEKGVARLLRVPLDGGPEREIEIDGALRPGADLGSNAIRDGKLLTVAVAPDSWYWLPAVLDLTTGKLTRIQTDYPADYWFLNWTPDGQVLATAGGLRSSIWRFAPEGKH